MPLPRGLTDITIAPQTREQRLRSDEAARHRDWRTVDENKPALVLHFGDRQVRFSTSLRSLDTGVRQVDAIQKEFEDGLMQAEPAVFDTRPTAWARLLRVTPFD